MGQSTPAKTHVADELTMGATEEITCRVWFSNFMELRALHQYRLPIALHGRPMPLDLALPAPF